MGATSPRVRSSATSAAPRSAVDQPTAPTDVTDGWPEPTEPLLLSEPPEVAAPLITPLSSADDVTESTFIIDGTSSGPPSTITTLDTTTSLPATGPTATSTAEMPAIFDGSADLAEYAPPRESFRVRVVFILSLFGAIAVLMTVVADVVDIRTTRPAAGIATGPRSLADLGSSLGPAAYVGAAIMVLGGLLACFGLRWGAGLAGGAGLALAGWAGLSIGLAELPIAIAESVTRTSTEEFTLRVTRDVGWWLIVAVGLFGILVFVTSLRSVSAGGQRALNPLIAAVTAVASVILAFGPLIPVGNASFSDNFRSPDPNFDLPTAFFAGRLGQVGLIAACRRGRDVDRAELRAGTRGRGDERGRGALGGVVGRAGQPPDRHRRPEPGSGELDPACGHLRRDGVDLGAVGCRRRRRDVPTHSSVDGLTI